MKQQKKKVSVYWKWVIVVFLIDLLLHILARIPFICDWYTDHVFGFASETYGRFTALFPISVGEILLILAILLALLQIFAVLALIILHRKSKYRRFVKLYSKSFLVFFLIVTIIMCLNCSMLYGCSKLNVKGHIGKEYAAEDVQKLWNHVAAQCNRLAFEIERDEEGYPYYEGDINDAVKQAMQQLAADYPRLQGTYPDPKPIYFSYLMYQTDYTGVYFPFSMEANYNTYLSDLGYPSVVAHELSHLKGYIYEDEADFMAYLACIHSEEPYLQYSGYLSVLGFLQTDYLEMVSDDSEDVHLLEQVVKDDQEFYFTKETVDEVETIEPVFDEETVETISDGVTDTYMDYYNAEPNYAEVTKLMLAYYDGVLY